nr:hypothetical protein Iba_chr15cCG5680 [Ipomoea batatas]
MGPKKSTKERAEGSDRQSSSHLPERAQLEKLRSQWATHGGHLFGDLLNDPLDIPSDDDERLETALVREVDQLADPDYVAFLTEPQGIFDQNSLSGALPAFHPFWEEMRIVTPLDSPVSSPDVVDLIRPYKLSLKRPVVDPLRKETRLVSS